MDKSNLKRKEISYFEGLNGTVASNLEKSTEFSHIENARCEMIGSIEKRKGILNLGTLADVYKNYMLAYFPRSEHLIRLSSLNNNYSEWSEIITPTYENDWKTIACSENGNFLMIGGETDSRLYTSANAGEDWTERSPASSVSKTWNKSCSSSDGSIIYATYSTGRMFKSSNSGDSWTEVQPLGDVDVNYVSIECDSTGTYLIITDGSRIYVSTNSGSSWSEKRPLGDKNIPWYSVAISANGTYLMASHNNYYDAEVKQPGLYTSANGGSSWTKREPASGTNKYYNSCTMNSTGQVMGVCVYNDYIYISSDYGSSWTPRGVTQEWKFLRINKTNSAYIIALSNKVYSSSSGGSSWIEQKPLGSITDSWIAGEISNTGLCMIVSNSNRLYGTKDSGSTWAQLMPNGDVNINWSSICGSYDLLKSYALGRNDKIYTSTDTITTWTRKDPYIVNTTSSWICLATDNDGSNLISGEYGGYVYISTDYGVTWTKTNIKSGSTGNWYSTASDSNGTSILVSEYAGRLYKTSNGGSTWAETKPAGDFNLTWKVAISSDGNSAIVGALSERLYTTVDLTTWTERQPAGDFNKNWQSVSMDSYGIVMMACCGESAYLSTDYGVNWSSIDPSNGDYPYFTECSVSSDGNKLIITNGKDTFLSVDQGVSWTKQPAFGDPTDNWGMCVINGNDNSFKIIRGSSLYQFKIQTLSQNPLIYYYNATTPWTLLKNGDGCFNLEVSDDYPQTFDYTIGEDCIFFTNLACPPRYIYVDDNNNLKTYEQTIDLSDPVSVSNRGHLFNCPNAAKINYYKNRLYVADYLYNNVRYKNRILMSSPVLGIISLVNNDIDYTFIPGSPQASIPISVTENKYFYTDQGANEYEIYRGETKIADIIVTKIDQFTITATVTTAGTQTQILSSDEIWAKDTYKGKKFFRWPLKTDSSGDDFKKYDSFVLSGAENDEVTLLANVGNVMMMANKNSMSSWNDSTITNYDLNVGCVSRNGYVKSMGVLFFLHYNGIWSTTGEYPKMISNKVKKYIDGATKEGKESCVAGKKDNSVFFSIGDSTLYKPDGSIDKTLHDVVLEYNIIQSNWFIHTDIKPTQFATFIDSNNTDRLIYISNEDTDNPTIELLVGENDNGNAIPFRVDTPTLRLGNTFEALSQPIEIVVEAERGSSMSCFVSIDGEPFYELNGKIKKGVTVLKVHDKSGDILNIPKCRTIKISIRDFSKQICKITKLAINYIPTNEVDDNNEEND